MKIEKTEREVEYTLKLNEAEMLAIFGMIAHSATGPAIDNALRSTYDIPASVKLRASLATQTGRNDFSNMVFDIYDQLKVVVGS